MLICDEIHVDIPVCLHSTDKVEPRTHSVPAIHGQTNYLGINCM